MRVVCNKVERVCASSPPWDVAPMSLLLLTKRGELLLAMGLAPSRGDAGTQADEAPAARECPSVPPLIKTHGSGNEKERCRERRGAGGLVMLLQSSLRRKPL